MLITHGRGTWAWGLAPWFILHALSGREIPLPGRPPEEVAFYAHWLIWKTAAAVLSFRRAGKKRRNKLPGLPCILWLKKPEPRKNTEKTFPK